MESSNEKRPGGLPSVASVEAAHARIVARREGRALPPEPVSSAPTRAEADYYAKRPGGKPSLADVEAAHRRIVARREGRPISPADQPAPSVDVSKFEPRAGGKPSVAAVEEAEAMLLARHQAARAQG